MTVELRQCRIFTGVAPFRAEGQSSDVRNFAGHCSMQVDDSRSYLHPEPSKLETGGFHARATRF